jgi:hypothetical protein
MNEQQFIVILLAIVGFIGGLMVKQLVRIADSVQRIHSDLKVLTNDHNNLKEGVCKMEKRIDLVEIKISK